MAWLNDNPPARSQYRHPRREAPSGVIAVHTAENTPDYVAFDGGAEAVARFIRDRDTPGSYHELVDSDSGINLVDYGDEAFHDGTGTNPHSFGLSVATRADVWPLAPKAWRDGAVEQAAQRAARYARWIKDRRGIVVPARRITATQARARVPGFVTHAELDPTRRTDPGKAFPFADFLERFEELTNPKPTPEPEDPDDMPKPMLCRLGAKDPAVLYVSAAKLVNWVPDPAALEGYKDLQRLDGASPDVCVLSSADKDPNIVSLHNAVRTLPFVGDFPPAWPADYWRGPHLKSA